MPYNVTFKYTYMADIVFGKLQERIRHRDASLASKISLKNTTITLPHSEFERELEKIVISLSIDPRYKKITQRREY